MEQKDIYNIGLIFIIGFFAYVIFRRMNYQEGFDISTPSTPSTTTPSTTGNGVATNAANYSAQIKIQSDKLLDSFSITKYRTDYENVIINMSDLVNSLMLQTVLSTDSTNPQQSLAQLVQLNNAKAALNNVMIFIDGK